MAMKAFKLTTKKETKHLPSCIIVSDFKGDVMVTIWSDGRITPSEMQQDYYLDEINYFMVIANNYFIFYNNLEAKDREIERLQFNCNQVLERQ